MFTKRVLAILFAVAATAVIGGSVFAQDKPKQDDSRTVTKWVAEVAKPGLDNNDWEEIGTADSFEDAGKLSEKWNKAHPGNTRMTREREITVRIIPPDRGSKTPVLEENSGPKGGLITQPELKTVDTGAMKTGGKAASVAGKTGTGMIGDKKATITFTGKGEKGEFVIDGEVEGTGGWVQLGKFVRMTSKRGSKFEGTLEGNTQERRRKGRVERDVS